MSTEIANLYISQFIIIQASPVTVGIKKKMAQVIIQDYDAGEVTVDIMVDLMYRIRHLLHLSLPNFNNKLKEYMLSRWGATFPQMIIHGEQRYWCIDQGDTTKYVDLKLFMQQCGQANQFYAILADVLNVLDDGL